MQGRISNEQRLTSAINAEKPKPVSTRGVRQTQGTTNISSSLQTGGNLSLSSGGDTTLTAAQVSSGIPGLNWIVGTLFVGRTGVRLLSRGYLAMLLGLLAGATPWSWARASCIAFHFFCGSIAKVVFMEKRPLESLNACSLEGRLPELLVMLWVCPYASGSKFNLTGPQAGALQIR